MKFFESVVEQANKNNYTVCGDTCQCHRSEESTLFVLCDGIGSGVYASVASICCADRLMELFCSGVSFREACEMVADSMHLARTKAIPFSAFTAVKILNDGNYSIYTYESPSPIVIKDNTAIVLKPHFYTAGYEIIGETFGTLLNGDSLMVFSDGVSQAGLGNGFTWGIESEGIAHYLNKQPIALNNVRGLLKNIVSMTAEISGGAHMDDTTVALLKCREANMLNILSGPPTSKSQDKIFVKNFIELEGHHAICGSTTADIVARELHKKVDYITTNPTFASPPEYRMEGIDMVTEGAVALSQVNNILDEDPETFTGTSPVERLCKYMNEADMITFMVGKALNDAHGELIFKQIGVRPRLSSIEQITQKLINKGKLVVIEYF